MKDFSRRGFLTGMAALVGGIALEKAIPLGRVWSFPSQIVIPQRGYVGPWPEYLRTYLFGRSAVPVRTEDYFDYFHAADLDLFELPVPALEMQRELSYRLRMSVDKIIARESRNVATLPSSK